LPTAGEGTLSGFSKALFPDESLYAKSGSMTRVRCYAGYLKTDNGSNLAFSIMFNNFDSTQTKLIHEIEGLLFILKKDK
jgi:D-alanyl-D-alanine carboxypeptidase/D-alanyl-D-alanine-endopeptidase (penicillin-binding protein 4)